MSGGDRGRGQRMLPKAWHLPRQDYTPVPAAHEGTSEAVLGAGGKASCLLKSRPELKLFPTCQLILWLSLHLGSLALLSKEGRWPLEVSLCRSLCWAFSHWTLPQGCEAGILISFSIVMDPSGSEN